MSTHVPAGSTYVLLTQSDFTRRYWYPLSYFSSLVFQPTAMIGLNAELQLPKFSLECNIKPSVFAYPPPISAEAAQEVLFVPHKQYAVACPSPAVLIMQWVRAALSAVRRSFCGRKCVPLLSESRSLLFNALASRCRRRRCRRRCCPPQPGRAQRPRKRRRRPRRHPQVRAAHLRCNFNSCAD